MKQHMNRNLKIWLMLATVVAMALLAVFWVTTTTPVSPPFEPRPWPRDRLLWDVEFFYTIKAVVSAINATLLVFLLITYIDIYRKTRSEFTIGLIIFSIVLLLYALVSNPIIHRVFGFIAFGLGPFAMLPDLFTCVALAVLLYLTFKY